MRRLITLILAILSLLLAHTQAVAADLVEAASKATELKMFTSAIEAAGMKDELREKGPYTIFAPSDAAFGKLPKGTMEALMKDREKLRELLEHHIIPGKFTVSEVKPGEVNTLEGSTVKLTSDNGKVTVDGANVTQSDIMADNGIVHEIDTVILPESAQSSGK